MKKINHFFKVIFWNKSRKIIFIYLFILFLSTLILSSPFVLNKENNFDNWNFFTSFFTSTSAFSNTGLVINKINEQLNFFGQLIILFLIQIGGIGIISIKLMLFNFFFLNNKSKLLAIQEKGVEGKIKNIDKILKVSIATILIIEIFASFLIFINLYFFFNYDETFKWQNQSRLLNLIWIAIFHSVSATNNAGFNIFSLDYLNSFKYDYLTQIILIFLWIIGGMGFNLIYDFFLKVKFWFKGKKKSLSFSSIISFYTYFFILFLSIFLVLIIEWINFNLGNKKDSLISKYGNSSWMIIFFNTLSTRSAGFSSIPLKDFHCLSLVVHVILMIIGGSPFSTGGGIRTTTLFLIFLILFKKKKRKKELVFKNNKISFYDQKKSFLIFTLASILIIFSSLFLYFFESFKNNQNISFFLFFYECSSAFGNSGLTLLNYRFSYFSYLILIILMLSGQMGIFNMINIFSFKKEKQNFDARILF